MINNISQWLDKQPTLKQWGWFVILWAVGLLTVTTLTYPIKWLFRFL